MIIQCGIFSQIITWLKQNKLSVNLHDRKYCKYCQVTVWMLHNFNCFEKLQSKYSVILRDRNYFKKLQSKYFVNLREPIMVMHMLMWSKNRRFKKHSHLQAFFTYFLFTQFTLIFYYIFKFHEDIFSNIKNL